ncbi:MAG TPA: carboxymuconolactone decarboxylase family protein [Chloroflexota bacterium]|nr:carboxymuconolactone decarboxylase family protein [Chloroflexota bacterium]
MAETDRLALGEDVRRRLQMNLETSSHRFDAIDPTFSGEVDRYLSAACFGDVWARPGLDLKTRRLLTIAIAAALGRERQLRAHLAGALQDGISLEEVRETVVHVIPYAGFPAGLTGLELLTEVVKSR